MSIEPYNTRRAFASAAPGYDRHAVLQRRIGRVLLERVANAVEPGSVWLDVGAGTGWISRQLLMCQPACQMVAVDFALAMLQQAVGVAPLFSVCADAEALPVRTGCCDGVVSNLALQWCVPPAAAFAETYRVLKPGGWLAFSVFGGATLAELRAAWGAANQSVHVNDFLSCTEWSAAVTAAGFVELRSEVQQHCVRYTGPLALMRELKGLGAHHVHHGRSACLTGKGTWSTVLAAYPRDAQGYAPATFEVIFAIARKPGAGATG